MTIIKFNKDIVHIVHILQIPIYAQTGFRWIVKKICPESTITLRLIKNIVIEMRSFNQKGHPTFLMKTQIMML